MGADSVRPATLDEIPRCIRLLRNFHSGGGFDFSFDAPRLDRFLKSTIASPDGVVFVSGRPVTGLIVASRFESPIAPYACAIERLIWVEPSARGRAWDSLLDAFEQWARDTGCRRAMLYSQVHMRGEAVGRLFRRRGYHPLETAYSKTL